jgi:hypothetical protein
MLKIYSSVLKLQKTFEKVTKGARVRWLLWRAVLAGRCVRRGRGGPPAATGM